MTHFPTPPTVGWVRFPTRPSPTTPETRSRGDAPAVIVRLVVAERAESQWSGVREAAFRVLAGLGVMLGDDANGALAEPLQFPAEEGGASRPVLASVTLGSAPWPAGSPGSLGFGGRPRTWIATYDELTAEGRALYHLLSALFSPHGEVFLQTWAADAA